MKYSMSATQWHHFLASTPKIHWETIDETGVSERFNHSETPLSCPISMPRKAFETAPFLVPLISYKKRWMKKKVAGKELFPLRDFNGNISTKRSETLQRFNPFFASGVSSVSSVSIWNAVRHDVSDRVSSVLVLNIGISFVIKFSLRCQETNY